MEQEETRRAGLDWIPVHLLIILLFWLSLFASNLPARLLMTSCDLVYRLCCGWFGMLILPVVPSRTSASLGAACGGNETGRCIPGETLLAGRRARGSESCGGGGSGDNNGRDDGCCCCRTCWCWVELWFGTWYNNARPIRRMLITLRVAALKRLRHLLPRFPRSCVGALASVMAQSGLVLQYRQHPWRVPTRSELLRLRVSSPLHRLWQAVPYRSGPQPLV